MFLWWDHPHQTSRFLLFGLRRGGDRADSEPHHREAKYLYNYLVRNDFVLVGVGNPVFREADLVPRRKLIEGHSVEHHLLRVVGAAGLDGQTLILVVGGFHRHDEDLAHVLSAGEAGHSSVSDSSFFSTAYVSYHKEVGVGGFLPCYGEGAKDRLTITARRVDGDRLLDGTPRGLFLWLLSNLFCLHHCASGRTLYDKNSSLPLGGVLGVIMLGPSRLPVPTLRGCGLLGVWGMVVGVIVSVCSMAAGL